MASTGDPTNSLEQLIIERILPYLDPGAPDRADLGRLSRLIACMEPPTLDNHRQHTSIEYAQTYNTCTHTPATI